MAPLFSWGEALDDFEEVLARQRAALQGGRPQDLPAFVPPTGLGPLPPQLRERAAGLVADSQRLEVGAEAQRALVGAELARARAAAEAAKVAPRPAFLDQRV